MAKLSRSQLKGIVKECLMEILTEGLASSDSSLTENIRPSKKRASRRPAAHRAPVDTVSFNRFLASSVAIENPGIYKTQRKSSGMAMF